jgi:hypothetical protein
MEITNVTATNVDAESWGEFVEFLNCDIVEPIHCHSHAARR